MDKDDKAILELLRDIDILNKVKEKINDFNVFEILGIVNNEIRHSNMIAWLFNPNESHNLGSQFIKYFIKEYINLMGDQTNYRELVKLLLNDFDDAMVLREWNHIDILVVSQESNFLIAIENKIWSKESGSQLVRYHNILEKEFVGYEKFLFYLTPDGLESSQSDIWMNISYTFILRCINKCMKTNSINEETKHFLNQYIEILRRYILEDEELIKICEEIYFKHKRALDLIFEYKPDIYNNISTLLQNTINENDDLILDDSNKTFIRFSSKKIDECVAKEGNNGEWTSTNRLLLLEVHNKGHRVNLALVIGPGEENTREKLHKIAINNPDVFKKHRNKLSPKYSNIYSNELYRFDKSNEEDFEEILNKIEKQFNKFIMKELPKIEQIIYKNFTK